MPVMVATGEDEKVTTKTDAVGESEYETGLAEELDVTDTDEEAELLDDEDEVDVLDTVSMLVNVAVIDTFQLCVGSTDTDTVTDWNAETDTEELLLPVREISGEDVCQLRVCVEDAERTTETDKSGDALMESNSVLVAVTDGVSCDVVVALGYDVTVSIEVLVIVDKVDAEIEGDDEIERVRKLLNVFVTRLDADGDSFEERVKEFLPVRVPVITVLVV